MLTNNLSGVDPLPPMAGTVTKSVEVIKENFQPVAQSAAPVYVEKAAYMTAAPAPVAVSYVPVVSRVSVAPQPVVVSRVQAYEQVAAPAQPAVVTKKIEMVTVPPPPVTATEIKTVTTTAARQAAVLGSIATAAPAVSAIDIGSTPIRNAVMVSSLQPRYGMYTVGNPTQTPPPGTVVYSSSIDRFGRGNVSVAEGYQGQPNISMSAPGTSSTYIATNAVAQRPGTIVKRVFAQQGKASTTYTPPPPPVREIIKEEITENQAGQITDIKVTDYKSILGEKGYVDIESTYKHIHADEPIYQSPPPPKPWREPAPVTVEYPKAIVTEIVEEAREASRPRTLLPPEDLCRKRNIALMLALALLMGLLGFLLFKLFRSKAPKPPELYINSADGPDSLIIKETIRNADTSVAGLRVVPYEERVKMHSAEVQTVVPVIASFPAKIATNYTVVEERSRPDAKKAIILKTVDTETISPFTPAAAYWYANGGAAGGSISTRLVSRIKGILPAYFTNGTIVNGTIGYNSESAEFSQTDSRDISLGGPRVKAEKIEYIGSGEGSSGTLIEKKEVFSSEGQGQGEGVGVFKEKMVYRGDGQSEIAEKGEVVYGSEPGVRFEAGKKEIEVGFNPLISERRLNGEVNYSADTGEYPYSGY